ncbi:hypothetical protein ISN45_Aa07g007380 [Arabidopsis thaliana x Arabidopsis arenosa]|uniref:Uncharacterized protein n=1 Tax=Arabidopsis thaliana x Arabidopsis arenosa TaxID=1240361 RepID=A0A8T1Y7T0_9BRAS|nr:hypothetical protein ISN45_Aa07g007380 [Arabidopsis thaliana x Arabidopsis arenosa]
MMMLRSAVRSFCSSGRDFEVDAESLFRKMVAAVSHRTFLRVQNLCHRSPFFSDTLICLVTRCKRAEVRFLARAMKQESAGPIPIYNSVSASKAFAYTVCPVGVFGGLYTSKWLYSRYETRRKPLVPCPKWLYGIPISMPHVRVFFNIVEFGVKPLARVKPDESTDWTYRVRKCL